MVPFLDIVNAVAIFQLIFFTAFLFYKGNKSASTLFLKMHLIVQLIPYINYYYFEYYFKSLFHLLPISIPMVFLWAPTFYFYIKSRLYRNFKPNLVLLWHLIPAAIVFVIILLYVLNIRLVPWQYISILSHIHFLVYFIYVLFLINQYNIRISKFVKEPKNDNLNWVKFIAYGISAMCIINVLFQYIPAFGDLKMGYFFFWIFLNVLFFKVVVQPDQYLGLDEEKIMLKEARLERSLKKLALLEGTVNKQKLYLNPNLSLADVAAHVNLSERYVSQIIKEHQNQNFTDYINRKRIEYAKEKLSNPKFKKLTILEILYESGFNSKSVFNTQFKKFTGLSPTEFRKISLGSDVESNALPTTI